MENRHIDPLRRIYEADRSWCDDGNEPESFLLVYTGGGPEILHPRWDQSWSVPSDQTVDDLEELGILRVEREGKNRTFSLSMKGRAEAKAVAEQLTMPIGVGGRAPSVLQTLEWLVPLRTEAPECFEPASGLLDRAVADNVIDVPAREAMARQLIGLKDEGYLTGDVPDFDQANDEQRLQLTPSLELTMKASQAFAPINAGAGTQITVLGSVNNSLLAAGDINNFTVFTQVLQRAYDEIDALPELDAATKEEAKGLVTRLLGRAASATGVVVTTAGATVVAQVLARLVGLPLS